MTTFSDDELKQLEISDQAEGTEIRPGSKRGRKKGPNKKRTELYNGKTTVRIQVRLWLESHPGAWPMCQIAQGIGAKITSVSSSLKRMVASGEAERVSYGMYQAMEETP